MLSGPYNQLTFRSGICWSDFSRASEQSTQGFLLNAALFQFWVGSAAFLVFFRQELLDGNQLIKFTNGIQGFWYRCELMLFGEHTQRDAKLLVQSSCGNAKEAGCTDGKNAGKSSNDSTAKSSDSCTSGGGVSLLGPTGCSRTTQWSGKTSTTVSHG